MLLLYTMVYRNIYFACMDYVHICINNIFCHPFHYCKNKYLKKTANIIMKEMERVHIMVVIPPT